ncbi:hypothetical protein D3C75_629100 [compost metagenome]
MSALVRHLCQIPALVIGEFASVAVSVRNCGYAVAAVIAVFDDGAICCLPLNNLEIIVPNISSILMKGIGPCRLVRGSGD